MYDSGDKHEHVWIDTPAGQREDIQFAGSGRSHEDIQLHVLRVMDGHHEFLRLLLGCLKSKQKRVSQGWI